MKAAHIDNRWGNPGAALLPTSLRTAWESEPLPQWVVGELHLPAGSTSTALDKSVWTKHSAEILTDRQRNFLLNLVQARRSEIQTTKVFVQPIPYWLDLKELPFSTRTHNCLMNGNLFGARERLSSLTFGGEDLQDIYVTTAGGNTKLEDGEAAGSLFRVRLGAIGRLEFLSRIASRATYDL